MLTSASIRPVACGSQTADMGAATPTHAATPCSVGCFGRQASGIHISGAHPPYVGWQSSAVPRHAPPRLGCTRPVDREGTPIVL
eukprot:scaffold2113_cov393-Prasinococcus_capsulatus_cf.AAC.3